MTQSFQSIFCLFIHSGVIQQETLFHGSSHENIVHNRQLRNNVQLLIDTGNTGFPGLDRVAEDLLLAIHKNLALFGIMYTGQYLDQGRLTGTVLADQAMDFTRSDANRHAFQCNDTRKTLGNIFQFDDILAHGITSFLFLILARRCRVCGFCTGVQQQISAAGPQSYLLVSV